METTREQIELFIRENFESFSEDGAGYREEALGADPDSDDGGLQLTIATDDGWNEWGFQTGDNSYSGACYFFPHWAVFTFTGSETVDDVVNEIMDQLVEATVETRLNV